MSNKPINVIRDKQARCCATCKHATLVSYSPYSPLLAECSSNPAVILNTKPYIVMVANNMVCKAYAKRMSEPVIICREKRRYAS